MTQDSPITHSLTGSQSSIWAGQKLSPKSIANYLPHTFEIEGKLDPDIFNQAFSILLKNNDALRTIFEEDDKSDVRQIIKEEIDYKIELFEIPSNDLKEFIEKRIRKPIDLGLRPFDSVLIKTDSGSFIWYLNIHHIVADASSFKILFEQQAKEYFNLIDGKESSAEKDSASFLEYREFEANKRGVKESNNEDYWGRKGQLAPKKPKLYGYPEDPTRNKGRRVKLPIDESLKDKLDVKVNSDSYRSLNPDLTKFTIWATVFTAYISRVSGESVVRLGSPFPNRNLKKYRNTVGLLIEVLPFDIKIEAEDSFFSLFQKVRTELFDFFKHGNPGAQSLQSSRGIHFVVNYIPLHFGDFGFYPTRTKWHFPDELDESHQIRLQAYDFNSSSNQDFYFDINEKYFSDQGLKWAPQHFVEVFNAFLLDDNQLISEVDLGSKKLFKEKSAPRKILSLASQLSQSFKENKDLIALSKDGHTLNYSELNDLVNRLAGEFQSKGVKAGEVVAIHKPRSFEYIIAVLAVLRIGGKFVPIPMDIPSLRMQGILKDVNPKLIITKQTQELSGLNQFDFSIDSLQKLSPTNLENVSPNESGYILFTSGSTGRPKGVEIGIDSLSNYIEQSRSMYSKGHKASMPFFTSIGFDLTITSIFLPLVTGGSIHIYEESKSGPDLSVLEAIKNPEINTIKLTPSHARLLKQGAWKESGIEVVIFGGENLESGLASEIQFELGSKGKVFNEYGPTEATVGCIVHEFNPKEDLPSVLIGKPIEGCEYLILDGAKNLVPMGVPGELYLSGPGLAKGYWNNPKATLKSFIDSPFEENATIYKTGDLVRLHENECLEYLGRIDEQIKLNGVRIEAQELESVIASMPQIEEAHIVVADANQDHYETPEFYCRNCGLPSNYPDATFNDEQVCSLCESFDDYQRNVSSYFKSIENLKSEITGLGDGRNTQYDCLMLLSGGKDSSYALAKLVELDLKVLAFTLDNGFISDNAKANIDHLTKQLRVDHVYGTTEAMNAIFRDSIERHQNVCNGCFKTVYTLSTKLALDKNIPVIVTGLSRGQFFETRLTEELFVKEDFDPTDIDNIILEARKSYHRTKDAVSEYLDVSLFENDEVFDKVSFVDFYRFSDVSLSEMMDYLENKIGWKRPEDTGRSTNCIINDLGIYVHKKRKGYHNYAFPYSWDVRVGHKKREETIDELNDYLSQEEIDQLMEEIGFHEPKNKKEIRAYFKASSKVDLNALIKHMGQYLPSNMIPSNFIQVESFPLTSNGKIDKTALVKHDFSSERKKVGPIEKPKNKIEQLVHDTWVMVMKEDNIDVTDSFIALGGNSLLAIRIVSLLNKRLKLDVGIQNFFELGSIRKISSFIESEIRSRLQSRNN
ncbi:amino acid adenylation domain-containing protein [Algoriphagus sediminis]|uniref:Amino acid adenylation domain-containing protein n=1 Tax=Algoriphagus sediminis TaxID=3057113 RepID=A0ABT7YCZ9_9BACT|nr:amino acid adenylation domain-containing protein [Algoriphagus sediminis]MDN3204392.1 amino acid adenylation domain-containing protein [Algoriphagus sediminis]